MFTGALFEATEANPEPLDAQPFAGLKIIFEDWH
jgi:hypothetical protein